MLSSGHGAAGSRRRRKAHKAAAGQAAPAAGEQHTCADGHQCWVLVPGAAWLGGLSGPCARCAW